MPHAGTPTFTYGGRGRCVDANLKNTNRLYMVHRILPYYDCHDHCNRDPDCQAYAVLHSDPLNSAPEVDVAVGSCMLFGEAYKGTVTSANTPSNHPVHVGFALTRTLTGGGGRPVKGDGKLTKELCFVKDTAALTTTAKPTTAKPTTTTKAAVQLSGKTAFALIGEGICAGDQTKRLASYDALIGTSATQADCMHECYAVGRPRPAVAFCVWAR